MNLGADFCELKNLRVTSDVCSVNMLLISQIWMLCTRIKDIVNESSVFFSTSVCLQNRNTHRYALTIQAANQRKSKVEQRNKYKHQ